MTDIQSATGGNALLQASILRILATVEAGMIFGLYGYLDWIAQQSVPYNATEEFLDAWANLRGVYRLDATKATGVASFTGVVGTDLPAGTVIARTDGTQYATDLDWQIGSNAALSFTAVIPAAAGNAANGVTLTISNPIAGITSAGTSTQAVVGGADQELDASLRTRMLAAYAASPAGGDAEDYVNWCLAVPGCTRAWAVAQGAGPGSVLIYVMFDVTEASHGGFPQGSNGGAANESRITQATGDQLLVADHLWPLRPVTALVQVNAPLATPIDFTIQALATNNLIVENGIISALQDCLLRLGTPRATDVIYPSDINAAIESVPSVQRYTLVSPVTPITTAEGYLPTVGTVSFVT